MSDIEIRRKKNGGWDVTLDGERIPLVLDVRMTHVRPNFIVTIEHVVNRNTVVLSNYTNPNLVLKP